MECYFTEMVPLITFDAFRGPPRVFISQANLCRVPLWILPKFSAIQYQVTALISTAAIPPFGSQLRLIQPRSQGSLERGCDWYSLLFSQNQVIPLKSSAPFPQAINNDLSLTSFLFSIALPGDWDPFSFTLIWSISVTKTKMAPISLKDPNIQGLTKEFVNVLTGFKVIYDIQTFKSTIYYIETSCTFFLPAEIVEKFYPFCAVCAVKFSVSFIKNIGFDQWCSF